MEVLEEVSEGTSSISSERFPSRINVSSVHLMYDHDKLQTINLILSKVPEITHIYQLDLVLDMKSNKSTYSGQLIETLKWGLGIEKFSDGLIYYGEYENNQPNGLGLLIISEDQHYKGTFKDGQFHGKGSFHSEQNYYKGEWKKSLKHGYGEELTQGAYYKGWFDKGKKYGQGKLFKFTQDLNDLKVQQEQIKISKKIKQISDLIYSGEFKEDLFHGQGKIKLLNSSNVKKIKGLFESGILTEGKIEFNSDSPIKNIEGVFTNHSVKSCEITFDDGKVVRGAGTNYI